MVADHMCENSSHIWGIKLPVLVEAVLNVFHVLRLTMSLGTTLQVVVTLMGRNVELSMC